MPPRGNALTNADTAFRMFVDSVKEYGIFMLDTSGHIVSWNAGAERIKGYRPDEIIGSHFSRFYPAEEVESRKPQRELEIAAAEGRFEEEGWRVRKDGSLFFAHVVLTAVRDETGRLIGFGKVTRDMTDARARLEENRRLTDDIKRHAERLEEEVSQRTAELRSSNLDLEHANAALQTFAHSIAHDLRGPLRTIQGFAEILVEDHGTQLDDDGRDYTKRIAAAARRLSELVQNLLTYARLARSRIFAALEPVSWDRVCDAVVLQLQPEIQASGAAITLIRPLGRVLGQGEILTVVLHNLLTNAIKFVPPSTTPRIEISTKSDGPRLTLMVRDNGIGVPPGERQRIFTPFERLHANAVYAGTGLGLAIVAEAVQRLGGAVGVESDGTSGSSFWVALTHSPASGGHGSGDTNPAG
jgi:PAS domain S-box-containing protein